MAAAGLGAWKARGGPALPAPIEVEGRGPSVVGHLPYSNLEARAR